jgi:hypothetical protein
MPRLCKVNIPLLCMANKYRKYANGDDSVTLVTEVPEFGTESKNTLHHLSLCYVFLRKYPQLGY